MATRGIKLVRDAQEIVTLPDRGDVFTLRIVTTDEVLMPREIFAHQNRLHNPWTGRADEEFLFVCSPFDITIYPVAAPDLLMEKQFFRLPIIDVLMPSQASANQLWLEINEEVERLVTNLNRLDILIARETVRIGDEDESSVSSSESTSESESVGESVSSSVE